jgi:hypothetical protein
MATLSVLIGGDDRELQAALRRAQSGMRKFGRELRTGVNDFAKWGAAAAAAGAAVAAFLVKQSLEAIDAQAKMAAALNTSVASMATLERAAEIDGISVAQLETGVRKLATVLGESAQGTGTAVESLKRLSLTAEELAALPLDERLALINQRIREHIPLAEQAAVSADFFGERSGVAMRNLSPETIKEAAEEARLFGTALSDVDAKQVELANDSISRISLAMDGFWKQVTVQVAPALKLIGDRFFEAAKESGGMGNIATQALSKVAAAAGFVADAVDGIRRVFTITADSLIVFVERSNQWNAALMGVAETSAESLGIVDFALANIEETLNRPLPSTQLDAFWERTKAASREAADEVIAQRGRIAGMGGQDGGGEGDDAVQKRLDKLRDQFRSEDELQFQHRERQLEALQEFEEKKRITDEEAKLLREEIEQAHWERIGEIHKEASDRAVALEQAKNAALRQAAQSFMANLAGLMNTESRKIFEIGKLAAIGQAAYKGSLAVMDAWEAGMSVGGPFAPAIAAAYATAAGLNAANLINNIRNQQFGGGGGTPTAPTQGGSNISPQGAGGGTIGGGGPGGPTTIIQFSGTQNEMELIRRFAEMLNENTRDGGRLILA